MPNPTVYNALGYIGIAKQGSGAGVQGTPTAPTTFFAFDSESIKPTLATAFYRNGTSQGYAYSVINSSTHSGGFKFPMTSNAGGTILYAIMGGTDTITGSADPWSHALTLKNDLPWFTVERAFADQNYIERIQDCKMTSLKIEGKQSDIVWMTPEFIGSFAPKQAMAATVTFDADPPFMFHDGSFALNGVAAGSINTVLSFSLDFKRNVKPYFTTHVYPDFLVPTARELDVTLEVLFETTNAVTWYQAIVKNSGTTTATKTLYVGNVTITIDPVASPDHSIVLTVPSLGNLTAEPPISVNADVQMLKISGKAQRPAGGGDEITATIKNLTATAYSA